MPLIRISKELKQGIYSLTFTVNRWNYLLTKLYIVLLLICVGCFQDHVSLPAYTQEKNNADSVSIIQQISQKILFEKSYVNFAWGYQHRGVYIDNEGNVYSYVYKYGDQVWHSKESGSYTEEELLEKYNHSKKLVAKIDPKILVAKYELVEDASSGKYSKHVSGGADRGGYATVCYLYDSKTGKYKEIVLTVRGDWEYENLSKSAKALSAWLETVISLP